MKHYKLVQCLSNFNVKPPLHERKAPPLTTFWRFCLRTNAFSTSTTCKSQGKNIFWICWLPLSRHYKK